ncbi:hypothetical protein GLOIN_2v1841986 [Rhizophagus clarus]|uniref:Uncharacterized protein n=1 Tax=Rhizophagus clarus TaxID=94130 RepID=A0A8H3KZV2_9GLOM|nr:hypothetical protein GLOIN_2v1841986 [Rhizophagus clarus]
MSAITTKFVTDHKLTNEMSLEELNWYVLEILELLTTGMPLVDREKRHKTHNQLQKGACQVSDIIPEEEIIRETAQCIMRDSLSEKEVKVIAKAIAETSPNPVASTSSLSRLQTELQKLNVSEAIIEVTKILEMTTLSNKIQKERSLLCEDEGIYYPDHFSLELVKERLNSYDVSNTPNKQALADIMIILCIIQLKLKICVYLMEEAISFRRLEDPGTSGTRTLNAFLKKAEFLPETGPSEYYVA